MFTFDSLDDMNEFLREGAAKAKAAMTDEQRAITWGSYVMLPTQEGLIFGYVFTLEEIESGEKGAGAGEEELAHTLAMTAANLQEGRLYGRWYSVFEPHGELGTNHSVNCWPIDSHQFAIAASFGWNGAEIVRKEEGAWLANAYVEMATATASHRRGN